jgi:hypothetical protein
MTAQAVARIHRSVTGRGDRRLTARCERPKVVRVVGKGGLVKRGRLFGVLALALGILLPLEQAHCAWMSLRSPAPLAAGHHHHSAARAHSCCARGATAGPIAPHPAAAACACLRLPVAQVAPTILLPGLSGEALAVIDGGTDPVAPAMGPTAIHRLADHPPPRSRLQPSGFPRSPPPSS